MRRVKFIKDLVIEEVLVYAAQEVFEHKHYNFPPLRHLDLRADELVAADILSDDIPIHRFCRDGEDDIFVGYTPEVQNLLQMPFDVLRLENKTLEAVVRGQSKAIDNLSAIQDGIKSANPWRRLKFFLTGHFPHLLP